MYSWLTVLVSALALLAPLTASKAPSDGAPAAVDESEPQAKQQLIVTKPGPEHRTVAKDTTQADDDRWTPRARARWLRRDRQLRNALVGFGIASGISGGAFFFTLPFAASNALHFESVGDLEAGTFALSVLGTLGLASIAGLTASAVMRSKHHDDAPPGQLRLSLSPGGFAVRF